METLPTFSVVIPTYNTGDVLRKTLDSLVHQIYKNFEVIISDDGSTDDTLSIAKEYISKLNLVILSNENWGGPARPRNIAIKVSKSNWIAFLDHDDSWEKNKLEEVKKYINQYDVIFHDLTICTKNGKTHRVAKGKKITKNPFINLMINGNFILNSSAVVRKSAIENVNYIDQDRKLITVEDYDLWLKIALKTDRFFYLNKSLGYYFIEPGQNMSTPSEKQIERHIYMYEKYEIFLSESEKKKAFAFLSYTKARIYHKLFQFSKAKENYRRALYSNKLFIKLKALTGIILVFLKK